MIEMIFGNRWKDDSAFQDDNAIYKPIYEKERANSKGFKRKAFNIVDADYKERAERGDEHRWRFDRYDDWKTRHIKGGEWRYRNRNYWYDNLLKRVDNIEKNLSSEDSLLKYAERRGRSKNTSAVFNGVTDAPNRGRKRIRDSIGMIDGVGL